MKTLAVMRPKNRLEESKKIAEEAGFYAVCASPVEISYTDSPEFQVFLDCLCASEADYVIITSTNGSDAMLYLASKRMNEKEFIAMLLHTEVVAIGPISRKALADRGINVSEIPEEYSSEGLVELLADRIDGKKVFILRSDHGDAVLSDGLKKAGADVYDISVYALTKLRGADIINLAEKTLAGDIDFFAFTSALSASSFIETLSSMSPDAAEKVNAGTVGAIGYPTKKKLESLGIRVDVVPEHASFGCMVSALAEHAAAERV